MLIFRNNQNITDKKVKTETLQNYYDATNHCRVQPVQICRIYYPGFIICFTCSLSVKTAVIILDQTAKRNVGQKLLLMLYIHGMVK